MVEDDLHDVIARALFRLGLVADDYAMPKYRRRHVFHILWRDEPPPGQKRPGLRAEGQHDRRTRRRRQGVRNSRARRN